MELYDFLIEHMNSIALIRDDSGNVLFRSQKHNIPDLDNVVQDTIIDGITYSTRKLCYQEVDLYFTTCDDENHINFEYNLINISNIIPIGVALIRNGQVIFRNQTLLDLLQLPEELLYVNPWMHLQEEYKNRIIRLLQDDDYKTAEVYLDFTKEHAKWVQVTKSIHIIGDNKYVIVAFQNIDAVKQKELKFDRQQGYLVNIFESIFESIIVTNNKDEITLINSEAKKLLVVGDEVIGQNIRNHVHVFDHIGSPVNYLKLHNFKSNDYELESSTGINHYISIRIRDMVDSTNQITGKVYSFFEIGEEKKREKEILYLTYHDVLTGLHNRTFFEEQLRILDTPRKYPLSIILGDVNGLKLTNDIFGHEAGDLLLKRIARVLKNVCRHEDIISRWGGDEFIILLPNTSENQANIIMNRISVQIEALSVEKDVNSILPSLSLGYSVKENPDQDVYSVIKIAENNMYKRKMLTNSSIYSSIITSMTNALYERSSETEEHANRLFKHCLLIANELNISESEISDLELFAKLHDIGKIGIPDEILNKPSSLKNDEWEIMRQHPEIGFRIANATDELRSIGKYILAHHERYDGTGYPKNLKGNDIPILSRILSVVDAYDAMIHNRPYRKKLTKEKAIQELMDNAGTQFDPVIVQIFIRLLTENKKM